MKPRFSLRGSRFPVAFAIVGLPLASIPSLAQQGWAPQPGYGSPYAAQPDGYAQPQYSPPQYGQPQYSQPQYGAPQYAQQYPPQYAQQPTQQGGYGQPSYADQQQPVPEQGDEPQGQAQALNPDQLEQLVAPIALYPDALLAQVLAASTYPAQVAAADSWLSSMRAQGYGSPDQIAVAADAQTSWDPSVKSLTAFPQVLDMMAQNLQWTTSLGNAYYNQPQDVMQTVQVLRQRAEDAGNLQSTPQEPLTYDQGYIQLAPPSPQIVYVPSYDPWTVYGQPVSPYPGFSLLGALGSGFGSVLGGSGFGQNAIQYGLGIALSAFGHTPWGFLGWGLNWLANAVLFNHSDYFTHSTTVADWGLPHGGPRAYYGGNYAARTPNAYFGGVHHEPEYGRGQYAQGQYGRGPTVGNNFVRPAREFYGNRGDMQLNPQYRDQRPAYTHPAMPQQQAYNRVEPGFGRQQMYAGRTEPNRLPYESYGRSGDGYGYTNRPAQSDREPAYRAPKENYARGNEFSQRAYSGYGDSYAKEQRSGGFHFFGHGQDSHNYSYERAPKSFYSEKAPRGFSRENYGRMKMPKMPKEHAPRYHSSSHGSSSHGSSHHHW